MTDDEDLAPMELPCGCVLMPVCMQQGVPISVFHPDLSVVTLFFERACGKCSRLVWSEDVHTHVLRVFKESCR